MFHGSVIRKLAPSEEVFAHNQTFLAQAVDLTGPVDVGAMSEALDALLQSHPIFAGHLEPSGGACHQIVVDDSPHPGIWLVHASEPCTTGMQLDQTQELLNLRLKVDDQHCELTLYTHHSLADAHHAFSLLEELFNHYTDVVDTGDVGPIVPQPAPESLEQVLEKRGISKKARSGFERFMPAMFAYDLPAAELPPVLGNPDVPQQIPAVRIRLTKQQTADLVEFGRANQLSLNSLVAAAILLAEWERRDTSHIPIPYIYPVNLRYLLSPPVSNTGSTNPMGLTTFLAEIGPDTDMVGLARSIVASFRADLSDGVIQQSALHFDVPYQGPPPGLPPTVLCSDAGTLPAVRTPAGLQLVDFRGDLHCLTHAAFDAYGCVIFADQLIVELHTLAPAARESTLAATRALLCSVSAEDDWAME